MYNKKWCKQWKLRVEWHWGLFHNVNHGNVEKWIIGISMTQILIITDLWYAFLDIYFKARKDNKIRQK